MALWDRPELARAYREVRGVSEGTSRTWGAAFRAALPDARPRWSLDLGCFLAFFPGARAIDERRMPSRAALHTIFTAGGFTGGLHATIEQEFAPTPREACAKVSRRPYSTLQLIDDDAFADGLARYAAFCDTAPPVPVVDPLDLFVFRRT